MSDTHSDLYPLAVAQRPDATLLAACAEATRCEERCREINAHGAADGVCDAATSAWDVAFLRVAELPATTMAGLRAKAAALQFALRSEHEFDNAYGPNDIFTPKGLVEEQGNRRDLYLAWSLAADLLRERMA